MNNISKIIIRIIFNNLLAFIVMILLFILGYFGLFNFLLVSDMAGISLERGFILLWGLFVILLISNIYFSGVKCSHFLKENFFLKLSYLILSSIFSVTAIWVISITNYIHLLTPSLLTVGFLIVVFYMVY